MMHQEFLAGLPFITLGVPLPLSSDDFLMQASAHVSELVLSDLTLLAASKDIDRALKRAIKHNQESINRSELLFLDQNVNKTPHVSLSAIWPWYWSSVKTMSHGKFLRRVADDVVAFLNAVVTKREQHETRRNALVDQCFSESDPVARELALSRAFAQIFEQRASNDHRSDDHIFVYYVKLLVGERMNSFDTSLGHAQLGMLVDKILQGVHP